MWFSFLRYDDETHCHGAPSTLIYQWASYSQLSSFRVADGNDKFIY